MEQIEETISMLDLMIRPAFCVKNGIIVQVNEAARSHMITPETPVAQMLLTGAQEYADFENLSVEAEKIFDNESNAI